MKKAIAIIFFLLVGNSLFSQRVIVLKNPHGVDAWIVNVGDEIGYELYTDALGMYFGIVEEIKDSSFVMYAQEIFFSKVRMIKINKHHARKSFSFGVFMVALGVAVPKANDALGDPFPRTEEAITVGAFVATGAFFIIKGIVEMATPHKCYLDSGWKIKTVLRSSLE